MLKLKKTAIAVLALTSGFSFAGSMGPVCAPGNVTVPCERSAWNFGGQALYLQPAYSDSLGYVGVRTTTTEQNYVENDPSWRWGFKLEGSYHFYTGNDINLNWYHLSGKTNRFLSVGTFPIPATVDTLVDVPRDVFTFTPKWDAVNLEFGQHVDFSPFAMMRFHGGFQYALIKSNFTNSGTLTVIGVGTGIPTANTELQYSGFGPRTGADLNYNVGHGLGVYANAAAALLAGTTKANTVFFNTITDFPATYYLNARKTIIVPELEGKLGVNYTYAMAQGDLNFDIGYLWTNYFNAQQVTPFGGNAVDANFGLQGLFFGLKWVGYV